jgi:predicted enzyme related to lactoylglutathione lyase
MDWVNSEKYRLGLFGVKRDPSLSTQDRRMNDLLKRISARHVGVELYFDDLKRAQAFYTSTLGLPIADEDSRRYCKFDAGAAFICLERKGSESYRSQGKAVLFFEIPDLGAAITIIGEEAFVQRESTWAVLHDSEGHNILLLQQKQ